MVTHRCPIVVITVTGPDAFCHSMCPSRDEMVLSAEKTSGLCHLYRMNE